MTTPQPTPSSSPVEAIETHISSVFFTADRAFKLLKPVTMPFLDHSERSARIAAVEREFELNRRIAPDVYLGMADVREGDELVDRMIVMRRLPDDRRLSLLVDDDSFGDCLRSVARSVASFHARQEPVDPAPMATRDAVLANWEGNLAVLADHLGSVIDPGEYARVEALARTYLEHREVLFDNRIRDGFVRDGHGDLTADEIFCLEDGPRIIDCMAFNDDWRIGDVLLDIGFLIMDVDRLAGPDAARTLMEKYHEFSNEHHPASLAHHYVAYRAHVRAKVACLRFAQGDLPSAELARVHHRLCLAHLERARVRMVLIGGGPGVGKSTLARDLAEQLSYPVLVTDEIRKDITGTSRDEHRFAEPGGGIYDAATTDAAYEEQLREARILLEGGRGVVLDASWTREHHRHAARQLAAAYGAELVEVECELEPAIARERIARRMSNQWNPSDATPELVDYMASTRDPWPSATSISTLAPPEEVARRALAVVEGLPLRSA